MYNVIIGLSALAVGTLGTLGALSLTPTSPSPDAPQPMTASVVRNVSTAPAPIQADLGHRSQEQHAAFWNANRDTIEAAIQDLYEGKELTIEHRAILDELDRLSAQKDSAWSGLYWETDLDTALARAQAEDKLVLTLRMLGRLDEEFSCANSRFFRAVLYANPQVARVLNKFYVLHWSSERPVPRVTIDFGDGRVIETTITGNSMHSVLSPEGDILHAMPGLYNAEDFIARLVKFPLLWEAEALNPTRGTPWADRSGIANDTNAPAQPHYIPERPTPDAAEASRLALSKSVIESSILSRLGIGDDNPADRFTAWYVGNRYLNDSSRDSIHATQAGSYARMIAEGSGPDDVSRLNEVLLSRLSEIDDALGENTIALMRAQNRHLNEVEFVRLRFLFWDALTREELGNRRSLEEAIDRIRRAPYGSQYTLGFTGLRGPSMPVVPSPGTAYSNPYIQPEYTQPLTEDQQRELSCDQRLDHFYNRVYNEVFMTPRYDPWLGLRTFGVYDGLWHTEN